MGVSHRGARAGSFLPSRPSASVAGQPVYAREARHGTGRGAGPAVHARSPTCPRGSSRAIEAGALLAIGRGGDPLRRRLCPRGSVPMQAGIETGVWLAGASRARGVQFGTAACQLPRTAMGQRRRRCKTVRTRRPGSIHPYRARHDVSRPGAAVLRIRATPRLRVQPALASDTRHDPK